MTIRRMRLPAVAVSLLIALPVVGCGSGEHPANPDRGAAGAQGKTDGRTDAGKGTDQGAADHGAADHGAADHAAGNGAGNGAAGKTDGAKSDGTAKTELPKAGAAPQYTYKEKQAAQAQFKTFCYTCHGLDGKGSGPAAAAMNPKPRNWTDVKWQESVDDARIFKVIKEGGYSVGLSPLMAPNPMYQDYPGVIHALVDIVRSFKGK